MAIKIQNTSDISIDSVKCVVYGGAGTGKTRLCATAPKPIIISAESGLLSLADVDCDFIEINTLKQLDEAYRALKDSNEYDTICLDSLSEIAEVLVAELKPQFKDGRQVYMALADAMMPMLRRFRDIKGKNTIFTSKLIVRTDDEGNVNSHDLLVPGRVLPAQIPYMVDELFCLQVDRKNVPFLQTRPDRLRFCKDRSGALEANEEPNMTAIINKIMNKAGK
ncbi:MAG: AAA family ATPase [Gammaproteobacteria bacterium]|nr:MAG: AAA family ATPase [Gammaproteobacteria bacterium]